eukprot:scaffold220088_cov29-Prasinocladus_malaysianus.AAC.1
MYWLLGSGGLARGATSSGMAPSGREGVAVMGASAAAVSSFFSRLVRIVSLYLVRRGTGGGKCDHWRS